MFISRVELNTSLRSTQKAMSAPSMFHGAMERGLGLKSGRSLWRIDALGEDTYLLMVSENQPDFSYLENQFGVKDSGKTREYNTHLNKLKNSSSYRFRLSANPTHTVTNADGKKEILAHQTPFHQKQWLIKKSEDGGFSLNESEFDTVSNVWRIFTKADGNTVRIRQVTFEGILTITDEQRFRETLIAGIGRSKAYGCGLLTVAGLE